MISVSSKREATTAMFRSEWVRSEWNGGRARRANQRGQSLTEFVVIGALFISMISGVIEMTYIFRAKHTLNTATFDAVRTGTMHNALIAPMNDALARSMAPLFMQGDSTEFGYKRAVKRSGDFVTKMKAVMPPVRVISPTLDIFNKLKVDQPVRLTTDSQAVLQYVIPNDNLEWRTRSTYSTTANGESATISLQDANLLKIEAYWCQRLVVPGLDFFLHKVLPSSPEQNSCDLLTSVTNDYYIVIEASAIARMQTPITSNGNLQ